MARATAHSLTANPLLHQISSTSLDLASELWSCISNCLQGISTWSSQGPLKHNLSKGGIMPAMPQEEWEGWWDWEKGSSHGQWGQRDSRVGEERDRVGLCKPLKNFGFDSGMETYCRVLGRSMASSDLDIPSQKTGSPLIPSFFPYHFLINYQTHSSCSLLLISTLSLISIIIVNMQDLLISRLGSNS